MYSLEKTKKRISGAREESQRGNYKAYKEMLLLRGSFRKTNARPITVASSLVTPPSK